MGSVPEGGSASWLAPPQFFGTPVADRTTVGLWDDATVPFSSVAQARSQAKNRLLASLSKAKGGAALTASVEREFALPANARPAKIPGALAPAFTTVTSNGNYTFGLPAAWIGKQALVCVMGYGTTGAPNPGNPAIMGVCATMTVMPNVPGGTGINIMNFATFDAEDYAFITKIGRAGDPACLDRVIGQKEEVCVEFMAPLSTGNRALADTQGRFGFTNYPASTLYPQPEAYQNNATTGLGATGPIRTVTRVDGNRWFMRGVVQWRSDRAAAVAYTFCFSDTATGSCSKTFWTLVPGSFGISTVSAELGQWAWPLVLPPVAHTAAFTVAQDLDKFSFQESIPAGTLGLPTVPTGGWGAYNMNGTAGLANIGNDFVVVGFNEPIAEDTQASAGNGRICDVGEYTPPNASANMWAHFIPAPATAFVWPSEAVSVWDAHFAAWVNCNSAVPLTATDGLHSDRTPFLHPDTVMAIRLGLDTDDGTINGMVNAAFPNAITVLTAGQTVRTQWGYPEHFGRLQDLAGNTSVATDLFRLGVVVLGP